jgi:hypothetical protein
MSQRIVVGLEQGANWQVIREALLAAGAEGISVPSESQPDALVVTIPGDANIDGFLQQAKKVTGVRYAEPDAWRFSY